MLEVLAPLATKRRSIENDGDQAPGATHRVANAPLLVDQRLPLSIQRLLVCLGLAAAQYNTMQYSAVQYMSDCRTTGTVGQ